jgi:hypothetical protein
VSLSICRANDLPDDSCHFSSEITRDHLFEEESFSSIGGIDTRPWRICLPHLVDLLRGLGPIDESVFFFYFFAIGCEAMILGDRLYEPSMIVSQCGYEGSS